MAADFADDPIDLLRLARTEGVGPVGFRRFVARYGSACAALAVLPDLARAAGRPRPPAIPAKADAARELAALDRLGAQAVFAGQPGYPALLALLPDAPPMVAVQGDASLLDRPAVAIVGGRNASANGRRIAEMLGRSLAEAGLVVVSGLARGIDAAGHIGALAAPGGHTVAVVAGGLDVPYPPENADLQRRIAAAGAVVAEAPLGTTPQARHFPRRNRIIAGLSLGLVVVEAAPRSGSLITARLGQEAGRELFAVPGSPLDPRCHGSNDLIRQGAHLTETAADVLANLPDHPSRQGLARSPLFARGSGLAEPEGPNWDNPATDNSVWVDAPESREDMERARAEVAALLGPAPSSVDDLVRRCQFSAAAVMAALLDLELAGRAETLPGNRVALI